MSPRALLEGLRSRVALLVARGVVRLVRSTTALQELQVGLLAGETHARAEHFEPYGFTAHPRPGAEAVALSVGGNRDHVLVVCVADRRYRIKTLAEGEVAIHDDQGQEVVLKRDRVAVTSPLRVDIDGGPFVQLVSSAEVRVVAPDLNVVGNITATGQIKDLGLGGKTMAEMRATYNAHTHDHAQLSGPTDPPVPQA